MLMDKIIILGSKYFCNIGVSAKERSTKQAIIVDLELFLDTKMAARTDDIKLALNYSEVYDSLKNFIENGEFNLIETVANKIANTVLEKFKVSKIIVKVQKPNALADMNVKNVAVEITRERYG